MNNAIQTADTFSPAVLLVCFTLVGVLGSDSVLVCLQGPPGPPGPVTSVDGPCKCEKGDKGDRGKPVRPHSDYLTACPATDCKTNTASPHSHSPAVQTQSGRLTTSCRNVMKQLHTVQLTQSIGQPVLGTVQLTQPMERSFLGPVQLTQLMGQSFLGTVQLAQSMGRSCLGTVICCSRWDDRFLAQFS